jgi:hypothetical protein
VFIINHQENEVEIMGTLTLVDARNMRHVNPEQAASNAPQRRQLRAIEMLHTQSPLALFIQGLFEEELLSEFDRDTLLIWSHHLTSVLSISITPETMAMIKHEIHRHGLEAIREHEQMAWNDMTEKQLDEWQNMTLQRFLSKLAKDFPAPAVHILNPEHQATVNDQTADAVDDGMWNFRSYLVIVFRAVRVQKLKNATLKGKIGQLFATTKF